MMADGIAAVVAADPALAVAGIATSGDQALSMLADADADVALVDYRLPDYDGADLAAALKQSDPDLRIVMMTSAEGYGVVSRAISAGAEGFVHKTSPVTEIVDAIHAVADGESWFRPEALERIASAVRPASGDIGTDLTSRELEVLGLLASGASTSAIAQALVLSMHTVRNHVRNLMAKLHAHTKLEAVAIAARAGIVHVGVAVDEPN